MSSASARRPSRSRRTAPFIGHPQPAPAQFHALEPRTLFAATPSPLYDLATDASPIAAGAPSGATIPALNSLPSAKAQLYLDFDGDVASDWDIYDVPATPAYDRDGNPASFSDAEITAIQQVWAAVAEKFSPFNLNVTTVKPPALADKVALRAVIGGDGEWTDGVFGGIAYAGAFFNGSANTIYVFPENLADGHPPYVAEAIAHEAGHAFGLEHQSLYNSAGNLIDEYHSGDGVIAPIMGASYGQRGIWWSGTTTSSTTLQNDLTILAGSKNGFGYRSDDHGDTLLEPTPLSIVGNQGNGAGVIEKSADRDFFSFVTASGNVTITASPAAFGAMLDLRLVLYAHDGTVIATQDSPLLGETISTFLPAGSYRVGVFSADDNSGDIGQFTLSATLVTPATTLPVPTDLAHTILPDDGGLLLSWTDNAIGELGYHIQRSTDDGNTWLDHAVTPADGTSFLDTDVSAGGVYRYRIYAFSDSAVSPRSAAVGVAFIPDAPANLAAASITSRRVRLIWNAVPGATTYVIERGKGDGTTFKAIGLSTGPGFSDTGLSPGNTYRYRVRAANAGGFSDASGVIDATTLLEAGVPSAPTNFSVYRKNGTQIQLTWQDNSNDEIGFRIQWSAPQRGWETLGTVPADKTSIVLYLWRDDAEFRIAAYNKSGRSAYTADTPIAASKRAGALPLNQTTMFSRTLLRFEGIESLFDVEPDPLL